MLKPWVWPAPGRDALFVESFFRLLTMHSLPAKTQLPPVSHFLSRTSCFRVRKIGIAMRAETETVMRSI